MSKHEHWCDSTANLADLYRWLREKDEEPDPVEFLEKPWHWSPEWHRMQMEQEAAATAELTAKLEQSLKVARLRKLFLVAANNTEPKR